MLRPEVEHTVIIIVVLFMKLHLQSFIYYKPVQSPIWTQYLNNEHVIQCFTLNIFICMGTLSLLNMFNVKTIPVMNMFKMKLIQLVHVHNINTSFWTCSSWNIFNFEPTKCWHCIIMFQSSGSQPFCQCSPIGHLREFHFPPFKSSLNLTV